MLSRPYRYKRGPYAPTPLPLGSLQIDAQNVPRVVHLKLELAEQ